jgi:hypothetical protein
MIGHYFGSKHPLKPRIPTNPWAGGVFVFQGEKMGREVSGMESQFPG